jgi:polysaccharide biosynthesis/export protein
MFWPCLTPKDRGRPQPEGNPVRYFRRRSLSMAFGTILCLGCNAGTLEPAYNPPPVAVQHTDSPPGTAADTGPVPQQVAQAGPAEKPSRRSKRLEQQVKGESPDYRQVIQSLRAELGKSESARATLAKRVETLEKGLHDQSARNPSTAVTTGKAGDDYQSLRADLDKSESARAALAKQVETLQKELHDQPACNPASIASAIRPTAGATTGKAGDDYRIRAGDVLEIVVWKNQDLSRTVSVKPEGRISLPLLNEVDAAGSTPPELRDRLIGLLSAYIPNPEVFVLVSQVRSFNVSVIGQVNHPGRYELQSRTTVLEALALGGGLSDFASRGGISVLRSEGSEATQSLPFDYRKAVSGDGSANFQLRPGDIVVVP